MATNVTVQRAQFIVNHAQVSRVTAHSCKAAIALGTVLFHVFWFRLEGAHLIADEGMVWCSGSMLLVGLVMGDMVVHFAHGLIIQIGRAPIRRAECRYGVCRRWCDGLCNAQHRMDLDVTCLGHCRVCRLITALGWAWCRIHQFFCFTHYLRTMSQHFRLLNEHRLSRQLNKIETKCLERFTSDKERSVQDLGDINGIECLKKMVVKASFSF